MSFRKQTSMATIGNENVGIMQNGINLKNNLSRNRTKQPLGNLNNIIHNQLGKKFGANGGDIEQKKRELIQSKPKLVETSKISQNDFDGFNNNFKSNDKSLEQKWLEEDFKNMNIFDKIIEADKPRTKPITKKELDWIQFYEFGGENIDIFKDFNLEEIKCPEEISILPCLNLEKVELPAPPSDLFQDLNLSCIENILLDEDQDKILILPPLPLNDSDFCDMSFLNDSLESN